MKKAIGYGVLLVLLAAVWFWYAQTAQDTKAMVSLIEQLTELGDPDEKVPALTSELQGLEGQQAFTGILLAFLSAGLLGILFVVDILPLLAHKATHALYDSSEMIERDVMRDARSLLAQGEYESAIEAFRSAAAAEPMNRFPWIEIAKIQKDHLEQSETAIETLREALESQEWEIDDAAFFLFRIADLYDETQGDRDSASAILARVTELFPETRHSANATHKLREWAREAAESETADISEENKPA